MANPWQYLKGLFGLNADKADIPLTQDATAANRMSYDLGIPPVCSQDKTAGGLPPRRADQNELLSILANNLFAIQSGHYPTFDISMTISPNAGYDADVILWYPTGKFWVRSAKNNNTDNFNSDPSYIGTSWVKDYPKKDLSDATLSSAFQSLLNAIFANKDLSNLSETGDSKTCYGYFMGNFSPRMRIGDIQIALVSHTFTAANNWVDIDYPTVYDFSPAFLPLIIPIHCVNLNSTFTVPTEISNQSCVVNVGDYRGSASNGGFRAAISAAAQETYFNFWLFLIIASKNQ